jgi:hypothetical protein
MARSVSVQRRSNQSWVSAKMRENNEYALSMRFVGQIWLKKRMNTAY